MGMFDWFRCRAKLPDGSPSWCSDKDTVFQTKDFDCFMERYAITEDGRLLQETKTGPGWEELDAERSLDDYHGEFDFYDTHKVDANPGEDAPHGVDEWVCFIARFTHGQLESIRIAEHERTPHKPFTWPIPDPPEVVVERKRRESESLLGRIVWDGFYGKMKIVAENDKHWCAEDEKRGEFHNIHRYQRNTLFDSEEEAKQDYSRRFTLSKDEPNTPQ